MLTILQKIHIDEKFALVDEMLGIERRDYSVCRRGSYMSRLQDPVVAQEIKLKAKGVERINGYVLSYQTNLLTISQPSEFVKNAYKPSLDFDYARLDNGLGEGYPISNYSEILEDTPQSFVKMQTYQVGKKKWYGWSSEQHKFRNPIRQNKAHTIAIKNLLSELGDFMIIPIVVFSNHADLKITAPNYLVVNWCDLREEVRQTHVTSVRRNLMQREQAIKKRICPKCGAALVERHGRYGTFLGCSNYPKCKFTVNLD